MMTNAKASQFSQQGYKTLWTANFKNFDGGIQMTEGIQFSEELQRDCRQLRGYVQLLQGRVSAML